MKAVERFEDPEALFRVAAEAFCARDYRRAAACCDPVSLAVFRHERLATLAPNPRRVLTVDELLRAWPDWSRERAEYEVRIREGTNDVPPPERQLLAGVEALEEATALTPLEFFARALEARDMRFLLSRALREHRPELAAPTPQIPDEMLAWSQAAPVFTVLGTVADGERLAHVVFCCAHGSPLGRDRLADATQEAASIETNTSRRQPDGSWLLVGGETFLGTYGSTFVAIGVDDDVTEPTDAGT